jgi:hypothetical protein
MPMYTSLLASPSQEYSDSESKPFVESDNAEVDDYYSTKAPSKRFIAIAYILCALAIALAIINTTASVNTFYTAKNAGKIENLPRPDIFTGLPKSPAHQATKPVAASHGHSHNHTRGHSNCKDPGHPFAHQTNNNAWA